MRIAVKICGLTRPQDVQDAIDSGADAIGVVFDRGPCRVSQSQAKDLLDVVVDRPIERVAVVGSAGISVWEEMLGLGFDLVQFAAERAPPPPADWDYGRALPPIVPAFFDGPLLEAQVTQWRETWPWRATASSLRGALNVDGANGGGTGSRADWSKAARLAKNGAIILSGGLRADNLEQAISRVRPHAVDVSSGVEAAPGIKDAKLMRDFVEEVRRLEHMTGG